MDQRKSPASSSQHTSINKPGVTLEIECLLKLIKVHPGLKFLGCGNSMLGVGEWMCSTPKHLQGSNGMHCMPPGNF